MTKYSMLLKCFYVEVYNFHIDPQVLNSCRSQAIKKLERNEKESNIKNMGLQTEKNITITIIEKKYWIYTLSL